jgi:hypothetical protein
MTLAMNCNCIFVLYICIAICIADLYCGYAMLQICIVDMQCRFVLPICFSIEFGYCETSNKGVIDNDQTKLWEKLQREFE